MNFLMAYAKMIVRKDWNANPSPAHANKTGGQFCLLHRLVETYLNAAGEIKKEDI